MVCDAKSCSIPGQWTLPDVELTVLPADGKEPKAAAAAKPTEPKNAEPAASTVAGSPALEPPSVKPAEPPSPSTLILESEIAQKAKQRLSSLPDHLASVWAAFSTLAPPCVWPMVPITVNFFVKQGQGKGGRSKATGLAITYCLSIIGIFTAVGVLCSFFFKASSLQTLANNPWLNLAVAGLFLAFGLSLLGLFELRLPSFLLNASAQGENRGGLIGVIFMALTLTITSFTCTFPVVGGLLVMAAGGDFFYPIVGLATFATVIALPFFLLALSPSLILEDASGSGDWMNAVKVVGGLVEIMRSLGSINTAESGLGQFRVNAWFDAQVVLTSWIVLSAISGIYLLGLFRTNHDYDEIKVGPGRIVFGRALPRFGSLACSRPSLGDRPQAWFGTADRRHPAARRA